MLKINQWMMVGFACLVSTGVFASSPMSPIGLWKTIDDVTGKPKALVQISQADNQTLSGTIVKIFPRPGYDENEVCVECKGDLHNRKMVGLTILNQLHVDKENAGEWTGGKILDPLNGKTYQCNVQLMDNNLKLKVRGYIGLPLFGRSQVWERVSTAG